ncbi:MAG: hypothetical protein J5871_02655 [Bacteroidales bacterium]|nr:hypothetical protein [Bacteroidales bacterium]
MTAGFNTLFDEAYFLLQLQEGYQGIATGESLWNLLAVKWFPYWDLTGKYAAHAAACLLVFLSGLVVALTAFLLDGKRHFLQHFARALLLLLPSLTTPIVSIESLNYAHFQRFLLVISICCFLAAIRHRDTWQGALSFSLTGLFAGLSLFVMLPSGACVLASLAVVIGIIGGRDFRQTTRNLSFLGLGVGLSVLYFHLHICRLPVVWEAVRETAIQFSQGASHGHTPLTVAKGNAFLLRDFLFTALVAGGGYEISRRVSKDWLSCLLYIGLVAFGVVYSPLVQPSLLLFYALLFPFLGQMRHEGISSGRDKADVVLRTYLLLFPAIAAQGTAIPLAYRMECYMLVWVFLWPDTGICARPKGTRSYRYLGCAALCMLLWQCLNGFLDVSQRKGDCHFSQGTAQMAKIPIRQQQKVYLDSIRTVVSAYGFRPGSSVMLATDSDLAAIYALDARTPYKVYCQYAAGIFAAWDKAPMRQPDFVLLNEADGRILAETLQTCPWDFPAAYDAFEIPSPDDDLPENRKLFCRKPATSKNHDD